jgi:orotidine-5'-phosphate decarboxylase
MASLNFADRLIEAIDKKKNPSCVGLDPSFSNMPAQILQEQKAKHGATFDAIGASIFEFNRGIIDAVKDIVPAVKPQIAFYEKYGVPGVKAFADTVDYAKKAGLLVIADAKRNDIGSTAQAYSDGFLGASEFWDGKREKVFDTDALTVNAYLGFDGVKPFVEDVKKNGKGIFILVKTSNPSSGDLQDIVTKEGVTNYVKMAENVNKWGEGTKGSRGYRSVGAVVGATYPAEAEKLRSIMKESIFLVPGYGAQGGGAADVVPCFNTDGYGAIVNSARGIIFAYQSEKYKTSPEKFDAAAGKAAEDMREDIAKALRGNKKYPW